MTPTLGEDGVSFTGFVLFYGDYPALAEQFLAHWRRCHSGLSLRVGMNACGAATEAVVARACADVPGIQVRRSAENLGKAGMMRKLFGDGALPSEWTVWFDDDSFPFRPDWRQSLEVAIAAQPEAVMLGIPAHVHVDDRVRQWIEAAEWYRGVPLQPSTEPTRDARLDFILGGFWALRTEWIRRLDWPDPRLRHFGDDYVLGEAIRQHGGKLGHFHSGVRVDTAPRRAPAELRSGDEAWLS